MDEQDKNSSRRSARSTAHHATTNNTTTNATTANAAAQNANNNNNSNSNNNNNTAKGTTTTQTTETTGKEEKQHPIIHYRIGEILTKHFARKLMKKDGGDGGKTQGRTTITSSRYESRRSVRCLPIDKCGDISFGGRTCTRRIRIWSRF